MTDKTARTLVDDLDDVELQGLAAADLAGQVIRMLQDALDLSDLDQKKLAKKLGVTPGRVSQVMNSDGNVRIAAVARYLRALGYEPHLTATPVEQGAPPLPLRSQRPPRRPSGEQTPATAEEQPVKVGSESGRRSEVFKFKVAGKITRPDRAAPAQPERSEEPAVGTASPRA